MVQINRVLILISLSLLQIKCYHSSVFAFALPNTSSAKKSTTTTEKNKNSNETSTSCSSSSTTKKRRKSEELLEWILKEPDPATISPLIKIGPSTVGGGDGLFIQSSSSSNVAVKKGMNIMVIPKSKTISLDTIFQDPELGEVFYYYLKFKDEGGSASGSSGTYYLKMAIFAAYLAKEKLKVKFDISNNDSSSSSSKWEHFLNVFPWDESDHGQEHILWWDTQDIETLLSESLNTYKAAKFVKQTVESLIVDIRDQILLHESYKLLWDPDNKINLSKDDDSSSFVVVEEVTSIMRSAFVSVISRGFKDQDFDCNKLSPFLDLTQHASEEEYNLHTYTDENTGDMIVKALRDIENGEELFINYSSTLEPYQFFIVYGFVPGQTTSIINMLESRHSAFFPEEDSHK